MPAPRRHFALDALEIPVEMRQRVVLDGARLVAQDLDSPLLQRARQLFAVAVRIGHHRLVGQVHAHEIGRPDGRLERENAGAVQHVHLLTMAAAQLPHSVVLGELRLAAIDHELSVRAQKVRRLDFAQQARVVLERRPQQRRQRAGDLLHARRT